MKIIVYLFLLLSLSSCYYYDVIVGGAKIIIFKVPIKQALADQKYKKYHKELQEVEQVLLFAKQEIKLKVNDSFSSYYHTEKPGITHVITASEPLKIKAVNWYYFFVGNLPFRGFFNEDNFLKEESKLLKEGYDLWSFYSVAYSTLGWFSDPVTTPMLEAGIDNLSESLFHELTHQTFFDKNNGDFNEQLAVFVAEKAKNEYLKKFHPELLNQKPDPIEKAKNEKLRAMLFSAKDELEAIYGSNISDTDKYIKKEQIVKNYELEITKLFPKSSAKFRIINNARLMQLVRYSSESNNYIDEIWQNANGNWDKFWELVPSAAKNSKS